MSELYPLAEGFVLSCPAMAAGPSPVREIRKRGNIPLVLQEDVVIELKRSDMLESWQSACALARGRADTLMKSAAGRISAALEDEAACDIALLAEDMKAFFLLAVRQKGLSVAQASRYCAVSWHERDADPLQIRNY